MALPGPISSAVWIQHERDGQTDGQTDTGRQQRPRLIGALASVTTFTATFTFKVYPLQGERWHESCVLLSMTQITLVGRAKFRSVRTSTPRHQPLFTLTHIVTWPKSASSCQSSRRRASFSTSYVLFFDPLDYFLNEIYIFVLFLFLWETI